MKVRLNNLRASVKQEGRLEYIDAVRWQDGKIHVLGRRDESILSDSSSCRAFHIIHDAQTGTIIAEDSFVHRGNFPLFMCGCFTLACEGDHPPLLCHELAIEIQQNRTKAEQYDHDVRKFRDLNLVDIGKKL